MKEILKLENLRFSYSSEQTALVDISLSFAKGEKIALIGNNGAGKSTLLKCCNGVVQPQSGRIFLDGQEVRNTRTSLQTLRQAVGLVFQDPASQMVGETVAKEISFGPLNLGLSREEVFDRVEKVIAQLSLEELRHRNPHFLSGGEKRQVSIAGILAMNPRMILFDEPTAGLDSKSTKVFEHSLEMFHKEGTCLLIATHDLDFAWRWADRIIIINEGKIVADSTSDKVFAEGETLEKCELEQPLLYKVGKYLSFEPLPRSFDELSGARSFEADALPA